MNIRIVTVYNSYNYGSYMQAKIMLDILSKYGDVVFLNARQKSIVKSFLSRMRNNTKGVRTIRGLIREIVYEIKEFLMLHERWKSLPTVSKKKYYQSSGLTVLGSDEIWNVSRKCFENPIFWGIGTVDKVISYAPSINNSGIFDFSDSMYGIALNKMSSVSVRDNYSKEVIERISVNAVKVVLDPTMLFEPERITYKKIKKPYIAVYIFKGTITETEINTIVNFAHDRGLSLVAAGQCLPWCDISSHSVSGNPFFVYEDAQYVVTNSFHGTAFAINYGKTFLSFAKKDGKICELLRMFDLETRLYDSSTDMGEQMDVAYSKNEVQNKLYEYREESNSFIKESLCVPD